MRVTARAGRASTAASAPAAFAAVSPKFAAVSPKFDVVELTHDKVKPGIPLLLPMALVIWAVCAVCYLCFRAADVGTLGTLGITCALACMVCLVLCVALGRGRVALLGASSVLIGVALAAYGACQVHSEGALAAGVSQNYEFSLLEDAKPGTFGMSCSASALGDNGMHADVRLELPKDSNLLQGDTIKATASLSQPSEKNAEYFWSQGLSATARLSSYEELAGTPLLSFIRNTRAQAIDTIANYGGEQAGLIQALVCGYRNTIQQSGDYEAYKTVGLAHLVAVSGAHLAIVATLFGWVLRKARTPRWLQVVLTASFLLAYLVFSGMPISALRAAFMVMLSSAAVFARRRAASLNSLAVCIIAFLAIDPTVAVSVSFFLSAGSTLGIALFTGLISSWFSGMPKQAEKLVAEPLGLTLSSNIVTLPYSAALFSQVPLLAPLANIVAAPLFSLACVAGILAACAATAAPSIAGIAIGVAAICAAPLSWAVHVLSCVPHACIAVSLPVWPMVAASVASCLALWLAWPKLSLKAVGVASGALGAAVALLLFVAPAFSADEIVMLDVGQGDAILIRSKGAAVLVDTGNQETKLKENLGALGVYSLDAVVITHHDDDHMGCLESLAAYESIGAVYTASDALQCACAGCAALRRAAASSCAGGLAGLDVGDRFRAGIFELSVVWPEGYLDEGGNGDSLCLLVQADCDADGQTDWRALLTGDAERDELAEILSRKRVGDIDLLKVGHHGSKVTLTDDIASKLSPEIALISAGANNRYGHPSPEALDILDGAGAKVFRTDLDGTVRVKFTTEGMIASTGKGA